MYTEDVQRDELETFLETLLDQEFDTIVDDGSTPEVTHHVILNVSRGALCLWFSSGVSEDL